jgi:hypothetical protein
MILKIQNKIKENYLTAILMTAMFFNPFGFDLIFYTILQLTGSYLITSIIFYVISGFLFSLYFYLSKKNKKNGGE